MSFVARLIDLVSDHVHGPDAVGGAADEEQSGAAEERLAVAALLIHVARADGEVQAAERDQLMQVLAARFGLSDGAARRLLERADDLDRAVDVAALIDMMGHGQDDASKRDLLAAAYRVAAADGPLLEFEDDLLWRLGRLLGFADDAIDAVRDGALGRAGA